MARIFKRRRGDTLQPGRFTPAVVSALKMKSREFDGQYQQEPSPASGRIFNPNWWRLYKTKDLPEMEMVVLSVDCSFKAKSSSDYVSILKWGMLGVRSYLMDRKCEHLGFVATVAAIKMMQKDGRPASVILIEDKANGSAVVESLQADSDFGAAVIAIDPGGADKVARANAASTDVEAGSVYLPEDADYLSSFLRTFASFPGVKHDDDVDSLSMFINWKRTRSLSYGVLDLAKRYAADIAAGVRTIYGDLVNARPEKPKPAPKPEPAAAAITRVAGYDLSNKKHPPCPVCKSSAVTLNSGTYLCNQDGARFNAAGDILQAPATTIVPGVNCCGSPLLQLVAGVRKCGNCGMQSLPAPEQPTNGITRKQAAGLRGQFALRAGGDSLDDRLAARFGRFW
jgi:predicted phage terminase large subunit-like protein